MASTAAATRWMGTPDGTLTLMFTDIVSSTERLVALGEDTWLAALRVHNALVRDLVRLHRGTEVKFLGDGWMVVFVSPIDAVRCAVAIQQELAAYRQAHPDAGFEVRIGLHYGDAVKEGADFLGKDVIIASRLSHAAAAGEILASVPVRLAAGTEELSFNDGRLVDLKGLGDSLAFPVAWT